MYFVFGKKGFLGYWNQPDGRTGWFSNLPDDTPMTIAQAREQSADVWLGRLRAVYADDVPGRELLAHTEPEDLLSFGSMEIMPKVPRWHSRRMVLVGDSAHAPSSSSGQGASLAIESAIQLAQCLRDVPDAPSAFARYEALRRPRVEKVAARAAKTNSGKALGPIATTMMSLLMPLALKTVMKPEKTLGAEQRFRIDWDETINA
jgi:2-polyprenyl-6-methoxyphenol hydroxylase-like FAD-dependent oxidoreductase